MYKQRKQRRHNMFNTIVKAAAVTAIAVTAMTSTVSAHGMTPGFEKETATAAVHAKRYELSNKYQFPASFKVEVFEKDFTPAKGWKPANGKYEYKLKPQSERNIDLWFKADPEQMDRKLIVCTTLTGVGLELEKPGNISRVCSRLLVRFLAR